QNRYMPESASSILASFGLSNEDLEELSRYPDDQLTPENMPLILREIRMRKLGHSLPALPAPSRGEEPLGGAQVKSKVIDYGHASKYGYTEDPLELRAYNPNGMNEEPAESRAYKPETPGTDSREDFSREQSLVLSVPPSAVPCNPGFEDLVKPTMFQNDSSNPRPFFLASDAAAKVPALCAAPAALPAVKPVSQPALLPVMPPMMPPPLMPPVMLPLVQLSMPQHLLLPMPQPPFPTDLPPVNQHERPQHEATTSQASTQSSSGHKPFLTQAEEPFRSPFGVVKASWLPVFPQSDAQKAKRLPTPSMMNDYYATSPRIFPHMCSLCNVECTHMKDWILHQNTPSHIESCSQLRQQYPDWNPEAHSSKRNDGDRKENQTPRRRSSSGSPSPRRSRHSSSSYVHRRSRSRSRSPGRSRPTRPRSRSPRRSRRFSPRHRSRSPYRSRYPLRTSSRSVRSSSHDWSARSATRSQERKSNLEATVKSLGPGYAAELKKHKSSTHGSSGSGSSHGSSKKASGSTKKLVKTSVSSKPSKNDGPGSSSSPGVFLPLTGILKWFGFASHVQLLRKELLSCGTVLRISDLPDDGFSDQDIKKIVQPFGKVSDLIVLRSRNEAFLEMNYKEAVIAAVKYGEMVPVMVNRKRVKISIAEKPKAS
ncbi:ZN638 protein, partial [Upupa epops]|nr:ZN638 protein [Upupa epops]